MVSPVLFIEAHHLFILSESSSQDALQIPISLQNISYGPHLTIEKLIQQEKWKSHDKMKKKNQQQEEEGFVEGGFISDGGDISYSILWQSLNFSAELVQGYFRYKKLFFFPIIYLPNLCETKSR